ncbi:MAG: DUF5615 family PIN-like protein [Candidatus Edwardsbacteria bacterium]
MSELKILGNENISPKIISFLKEVGFDAKRTTEFSVGLPDRKVVDIAKGKGFVILTFDLDFGELYYRSGKGSFGVWVLRIKPPTVEHAIEILREFIGSPGFKNIEHNRSLVIISETKYRVRQVAI